MIRRTEEVRLIQCYNYAVQGDWLNFDAVVKADLSWNSLIYSIPQELFKFLLNSTHNVLPTADNLRRWGKTAVDMKCNLCGSFNPTLKHILNGCAGALKQGRYTWRHDSILSCIAQELASFLSTANSCIVPSTGDNNIQFVKEGKKPVKKRTSYKSGMLFTSNGWVLAYDNPTNPLVIPHYIVQTSLRPDIIVYSNNTRQIIILELTVPTEENIFQRHSDKESKYSKLLDDVKMSQWTGHVFAVEVGSRGYVAKSLGYALQRLGLKQSIIQKLKRSVSLICLRCSYAVYLSRRNEIWRPWEGQHTKYTKSALHENHTESSSTETNAFSGFEATEIQKFSEMNRNKLQVLEREKGDWVSFEGFKSLDIRDYESINTHRIQILKETVQKEMCIPLKEDLISNCTRPANIHRKTTLTTDSDRKFKTSMMKSQDVHKPPGLVNLGNTCYMSSVMQCLSCLTPLTSYFVGGPQNMHGGMLAKEVGAALKDMVIKRNDHISLEALKNKVGELNDQFRGCRQQDSHEFLMFLLSWLREELASDELPTLSSSWGLSSYNALEDSTRRSSVFDSLVLGEYQHVISCGSCLYESISWESFSVLSLSIPDNGKCTLASLLTNFIKECTIDYRCPVCKKCGFSTRKTTIGKLPLILIIHLNRFEFSVCARKKQNFVDFPLDHLNLQDQVSSCVNVIPYNLCAVLNHYGTMHSGHYTSYCKPPQTNLWYSCDDDTVTRLNKPVRTSAAYLLFYVSIDSAF